MQSDAESPDTQSTVDFYFDPACPWTWYTATWLTTVAEERGLEIHGHPMSLWEINNHEVPDPYREPVLLSLQSLRLVQALDDEGRYEELWNFYRELGTKVHDEGQAWSIEVIEDAAKAAGLTDLAPIADESLDAPIAEVTAKAMEFGGQDIGSPVLGLAGAAKGFHGPIVGKDLMSAADADALWDAVVSITKVPDFFELKHGRG